MLRVSRCAARTGSFIAIALGRIALVACALLVVTVGTLASEARLPNVRQNTATWHTSKLSRMMECGSHDRELSQADESWPAPHVAPTKVLFSYSSPIELSLPELAGTPQAHGLRAPPRV